MHFCTVPWAFTIILVIIISPISMDPNPEFIEYGMQWKRKLRLYFLMFEVLVARFLLFQTEKFITVIDAVSIHQSIGFLKERFLTPPHSPTVLRSSVSNQCKPWWQLIHIKLEQYSQVLSCRKWMFRCKLKNGRPFQFCGKSNFMMTGMIATVY